MRLKQCVALTLIELLVTAYILFIGICGVLSLIVNSMTSSETAWRTTVATSHLESILEEIQRLSTLSDIVSMDWDRWATKQNFTPLPGEQFSVVIEDPSADPLDIEVFDQWPERSALNTISLRTRITK